MLDQDAPSGGEAAGVFPCKFLHKLAPANFSMCASIAQARTKSAPRLGSAAFYLRILSTCPFAFRLHRLVQTVGRSHGIHLGLVLRHFTCEFLHSCNMSICISTAQARTNYAAVRNPSGLRHFYL